MSIVTEERPDVLAAWQRGPCPAWCVAVHEDGDPVTARLHTTEPTSAPLTLAAFIYTGAPEQSFESDLMQTTLEQGDREDTPRVVLWQQDSGTEMTTDEARQLRDNLTAVLALADATHAGLRSAS